jgi:tetratricopeptide (TPR) repeat protein
MAKADAVMRDRMRDWRHGAWLLGFSLLLAFVLPGATRAGDIVLSPEAQQALDDVYAGDATHAIDEAQSIEKSRPDDPIGYAIETEARWWNAYCEACEVKWGMADAWKREKRPGDEAYVAIADKVTNLARAQLAKSDTAEMHVYAGVGFAFKARLYALVGEGRKSAHASVDGRSEFLRALQLDPYQSDAIAGMGIYNYFVDSLSPVIKLLRVFMGIPGGSKEEGIRQMKIGMERGILLRIVARFYLARNLRTFDHKYDEALSAAEPLTEKYPRNPMFLVMVGNLNSELGRREKALEYFRRALGTSSPDRPCADRIREVTASLQAAAGDSAR